MDSRLLPLLALLGAAGLKPSHWKGSPSQEPGTSPEEEHPLPGSSEPRPGSSTGHPSASSFPSTLQPPSPTMSSADSEVSPAGGPSGAAAKKQDSIVGTAVGRTQPPTLDLGGTERTGPPRALGTSWLPSPMSPSVATRLLTSFPTSALLPRSTSPKEAAAPTSLASGEFSRSGPEGKTLQGWLATGPSVLQDTWEWVSNPARGTLTPEPGSKSTAGAASVQSEASSVVFVEDPRTPTAGGPRPSGAGSWMSQESMPSPHTAETQGTLTPTRPPAADTSDPASTGSSTPSETLGPAGEAATASIMSTRQVSPRDQGSLGTGPELLSQKPGGSQSHVQTEVMPGLDPEAGPEDQGVVVGSLSPGTTLSQSSAVMGHMLVVMEETVVPDSVKACTTTVPDSHIGQGAEKETLPYSPALPSFAATPNQGTDGTEVTPHVSSFSRGATVPRGLVGSAVPPSDSDHALYGSSSTPGPSLPPSFVGTRLTDPTKGLGALDIGQDNSLASATHQHRMDLPPDSNAGPFWDMDNPATATGASWGFRNPPGPTEHVSRSFEPSPPGPTPFPLRGGLPGSGPSAEETWTSPAESGWQVPSTLGGVQKVLSVHTEQSGSKGSTSVAAPRQTSQAATDGTFVGMASEKTHPRVNLHEVPSLTGSPTGSETALLSMEGVTLNSAHAAPHPELVPSWVTALPTSAAPTREVTAASTWLRWTLRSGAPPARTQGWEWERDPMENSATEAPTPSPHHGGPVQATGTSGLLESSWQTWPPMPAPEPGSVSQSGPAIASTWLLAPMQEEAPTLPVPAEPDDARSRGRHVFVVENQPPLVKAAFLHVPCELVLAMEYSRNFQNPRSAEYQGLVLSINETVAPLLASLPGFQRLEVKTIRPGNVVVEFDALFQAEASGLWMALNRSWLSERLPSGLRVADARVLRSGTLERHLDLCAILFSCHAGYECTAGENGDAICTSLCHRDYCQNQGICTHEVNHVPVCQCPVGSDFWFLGMRCNYKVTQQGLLGIACGLLLSLVVVGTAIATLVIRRVRMLLLEARADQTKSSYRRFCRLDDVSAHYWSEPWLASASSLDNPAFSNSEELLHLQILDTNCGCPDNCMDPSGSCKQLQDTPCVSAAGRPSFHYNWDISSNSVNDPMIDSGKASEVSISSWPLEPIQWSPFPALHKLSGQQVDQSRRPHSYCEGMELVNLERSWTA